jgi:hypothetical protein
MATYTRQEILGRFSQVKRDAVPIRESATSFPCYAESPVQPEPTSVTVDFELILKQLEDQSKRNKEYYEKKQKKQKEFQRNPYVHLKTPNIDLTLTMLNIE